MSGLIGLSFVPHLRERAMYRDSYEDSINRHGFDEAMACQDMLERAPAHQSPIARIVARLVAAMRPHSRAHARSDGHVIGAAPNVTRAP